MCFRTRKNAAEFEHHQAVVSHLANGEEELYATKIASYSKGLPHNALGEVNLDAYAKLIAALTSGNPADFEAIPLGLGRKLTNPQSGPRVRSRRTRLAPVRDSSGADDHQRAGCGGTGRALLDGTGARHSFFRLRGEFDHRRRECRLVAAVGLPRTEERRSGDAADDFSRKHSGRSARAISVAVPMAGRPDGRAVDPSEDEHGTRWGRLSDKLHRLAGDAERSRSAVVHDGSDAALHSQPARHR